MTTVPCLMHQMLDHKEWNKIYCLNHNIITKESFLFFWLYRSPYCPKFSSDIPKFGFSVDLQNWSIQCYYQWWFAGSPTSGPYLESSLWPLNDTHLTYCLCWINNYNETFLFFSSCLIFDLQSCWSTGFFPETCFKNSLYLQWIPAFQNNAEHRSMS